MPFFLAKNGLLELIWRMAVARDPVPGINKQSDTRVERPYKVNFSLQGDHHFTKRRQIQNFGHDFAFASVNFYLISLGEIF